MMRITLSLLILLFCISSCDYIGGKRIEGNGHVVTQDRQIDSFKGVSLRGSMDVIVSTGPNSLKIEADENLLPYIEIRNNGGIIEIQTQKGYNLNSSSDIKVYATAPSFSSLEVAGSGDITSQSKIASDDLNTKISGSGGIRIDVDAPKIEAGISGSGSIDVSGTTKDFTASIHGSGNIHGFNQLSENTSVNIAGSGNAQVFASKTLDVHISGSGSVQYKGTPAVNQKISGSGSVNHAP